MAEVAYSIDNKPRHEVEVVVHVDESLGMVQRDELVDYLETTDGVRSAEFSSLRDHLMLVQYDRDRISSQDVIGRVNARNIHAELIGPL